MKIIIIGNGKVGFAIAKQLEKEGHDITIIENKPQVLESTMNILDAEGINGNGANYEVLMQAKADQADLVIAVTSSDEINIIACLIAKKIGTEHTIARIRNPEYVQSLNMMKDDLGLSLKINPEHTAAREITRTLSFPTEIKVSSFSNGRIEVAEIKITESSPLAGKPIHQIASQLKAQVQFLALLRNNEPHIPGGNTMIEVGDRLSVTGPTIELEKFLIEIGILKKRIIHNIMIVGGGKITRYLIPMLLDHRMDVTVIEQSRDKCLTLLEEFPEVTVIQGDGTDHELLRSEALEKMDAFIALTDNDEENVIISMYASNHGVEKVLPKVNRVSLGFLLEKLGLESTITPKNMAANQIVQYVRAMQNSVGSNVETLIKIMNDKFEILEFKVKPNCRLIGKPIKTLKLKPGTLISYITHDNESKIAVGDSVIQEGDTVAIITRLQGLREINDVLA